MKLTLGKGFRFTTLLLVQINAYALNPVQGWYAGLILGVSHQSGSTATFVTSSTRIPTGTGTLSYSTMGDVGGQLGYRCNHFRAEGELFYNNNPMNILNINKVEINSSTTANRLTMQGASNMGAFMVNGYYDLFTPDQDGYSVVVPYVGIGAGYAYIQKNITFFFNQSELPDDQLTKTQTSPAAQAIIGVSYFMDDFTTFALDFRAFSTVSSSNTGNRNLNTFNTKTEIFSVNLLFNGAFDFG